MQFLWVVGVEGAGHHMVFDAIFHRLKGRDWFLYESDGQGRLVELHRLISAYFDHHATPDPGARFQARVLRRLRGLFPANHGHPASAQYTGFEHLVPLRARISEVLRDLSVPRGGHEPLLFDRVSHPHGNPRDPLRRWDILEFVDLLQGLATPKLLVLMRNPVNATYSCLRRGFTHNAYLQARIIEDNFVFIDRQIAALDDPEVYRILDYDAFFADPAYYTEAIAVWLGLDTADLACNHLIRPPRGHSDIPAAIRDPLVAFFTPQRQSQWSGLMQSPQNLSRLRAQGPT